MKRRRKNSSIRNEKSGIFGAEKTSDKKNPATRTALLLTMRLPQLMHLVARRITTIATKNYAKAASITVRKLLSVTIPSTTTINTTMPTRIRVRATLTTRVTAARRPPVQPS